jgi:hypothetical protein
MKAMSFRNYLHKKAEESRHNETLAHLMFLAGSIFFVGGILETLSLTGNPEWFLFIPYHTEPLAGAVLSLTLETRDLDYKPYLLLPHSLSKSEKEGVRILYGEIEVIKRRNLSTDELKELTKVIV